MSLGPSSGRIQADRTESVRSARIGSNQDNPDPVRIGDAPNLATTDWLGTAICCGCCGNTTALFLSCLWNGVADLFWVTFFSSRYWSISLSYLQATLRASSMVR
ncbi:hypothetical protein Taro_004614 [Colocasia esculenta]|uniref:Uncharacterized protein n=1 Tax=Colocasia esculenta TaxID=4460 RepID=A0A843TS43_COLES|nr:hypothetical protein [Colocasia esculenta]